MILVLVDHDRGELSELSLQAVAFGRAIALRAELNLTPEQKQAIKQTIQAHRAGRLSRAW